MPQLLLRGRSIGDIQGVLFDKDGTLSHSEPHLTNLAEARIQLAVRRFQGGQAHQQSQSKLADLLSSAYGLSQEGIHPGGTIAVASREHNLISTATVFCLLGEAWPQSLALAHEVFDAVDLTLAEDGAPGGATTLLPGALTLLQQLQEAGVVCAVISNDTPKGIESFLINNNLQDTIPFLWSAGHRPAKPDPGAVHGLCKQLGLAPSECALIGDADSDLQMAHQANIGIILGYMAGWRQTPPLRAHQLLIHHWNELGVGADPTVPAQSS